MPVPCTPPVWPTVLREDGPAEDPTILLGGPVKLDGAVYHVMAVRVDPERLRPDFRPELDEDVYSDHELQVLLDELGYFGNVTHDSLITLESGSYIMLMAPQEESGA